MKAELRIDDVCARPGETARGFVLFDESAAGTLVRAPVILVNGREPGPTLVVTSGVHGDDLNTVPMTWRVAEQTDPAALRGQLILVPVVNPVAFEAGTHLTPADNGTPTVPGSPAGTLSQRIGHHLHEKIVLRADYLLDMHGGSKRSTLAALAGVDAGAAPEVVAAATAMAEAFDPDLIILMQPKGSEPPGGMFQVASRRGAPGLIIGMGQMGFNAADTARGARGVLNVLKHLGMLPGAPERLANPRRTGSELYHHTPFGGGFFPAVRAAQPVEAGDVLGTVCDIFGEPRGEVRAQVTGLVAAIRFYPVVSAGEWVASVARLE
jgi:predicted deacylase